MEVWTYGGELARLGGLVRLGEISPSLRNSYENMCSYEKIQARFLFFSLHKLKIVNNIDLSSKLSFTYRINVSH